MQHLWKIAAAENSFLASSWEKVDFPSFFISPAFQAADRSSRLELRSEYFSARTLCLREFIHVSVNSLST